MIGLRANRSYGDGNASAVDSNASEHELDTPVGQERGTAAGRRVAVASAVTGGVAMILVGVAT